MTAYSSRPTSTNALNQLVNLVGHGFTVGQIVIYDGAWVLAKADTEAHCAGSWMVSIVPSPDTFYVTQTGYVLKTTAALDVGVQQYLSPTAAGTLTTTKPTTSGQVVLPCFVADSTTTGFFYGGSGKLIEPEVITVTVNTVMQMNKVYIINGAGPLDMTLPAAFTTGRIRILGALGNGWVIKQNALQSIIVDNLITTPGNVGEVQSTANWNYIDLDATVTNTQMQATNVGGVLNVI